MSLSEPAYHRHDPGCCSLSRMMISEPGMTRFRLSICARMRQPESLRSLDLPDLGIVTGPISKAISDRVRRCRQEWRKRRHAEDEMVFVLRCRGGRNSVVLLLPVLHNASTMLGSREGLDPPGQRAAPRAPLDVDRFGQRESRVCSAMRVARRTPQSSPGAKVWPRPQRSISCRHHAQGR